MTSVNFWITVTFCIAGCSALISTALLVLQSYKTYKKRKESQSSAPSTRKVNHSKFRQLFTVALCLLLLSDIFQLIRAFYSFDSTSFEVWYTARTFQMTSQLVALGIYAFLCTDRLQLFTHFIPKRLSKVPNYIKYFTTFLTFLTTIVSLGVNLPCLFGVKVICTVFRFISIMLNVFYVWIIIVIAVSSGCLTYFLIRVKTGLFISTSITPDIKRRFRLVQALVVLNFILMLSTLGVDQALIDRPSLYGIAFILVRICFAVELVLLDEVRKISKLNRRIECQSDKSVSVQRSANTGF